MKKLFVSLSILAVAAFTGCASHRQSTYVQAQSPNRWGPDAPPPVVVAQTPTPTPVPVAAPQPPAVVNVTQSVTVNPPPAAPAPQAPVVQVPVPPAPVAAPAVVMAPPPAPAPKPQVQPGYYGPDPLGPPPGAGQGHPVRRHQSVFIYGDRISVSHDRGSHVTPTWLGPDVSVWDRANINVDNTPRSYPVQTYPDPRQVYGPSSRISVRIR